VAEEGKRRKTKKREELLQTAEKLLFLKGVRQLTVEEIVREARASKATFYKYFTDKQDILECIIYQIADTVLAQLTELVQKGRRDRLTKDDFIRLFDLNRYDYGNYFQSNTTVDFNKELTEEYPDTALKFSKWYTGQMLPVYKELIRMAKIDGVVRMDIDTDVLVAYTLALRQINPSLIHDFTLELHERMSMKDFFTKFYDIYLYGVLERDERGMKPRSQEI
jgi:AcrR family transcriptional regulator